MNFYQLVKQTRSCRRFNQNKLITKKVLVNLVNIARITSSAANLQPLRYVICNNRDINNVIFTTLSWAGYLKNWPGPVVGERPAGYIVIVVDKAKNKYACYDCGIAAQTICLGAKSMGLASCMIGSVDKSKLRTILKINNRFDILLVVALGSLKERVVLEELKKGNVRYYRDKRNTHHVPKRTLGKVILKELT